MKYQLYVQDYLLVLLQDLDGIQQGHRYHPEGDALFHSLQVFQIALRETDNPILLAAALFHDIGKSQGNKDHDKIGATMLNDVVNSDIIWLIEHHLDLLRHPTQTQKQLRYQPEKLHNLQRLRKWDLAGRDPYAEVMSPKQAITTIFNLSNSEAIASYNYEEKTAATTHLTHPDSRKINV